MRDLLARLEPEEFARRANVGYNAVAEADRPERWRQVRDSAWSVVDPLLRPGGRVAIVGGGNAHNVPLTRITARADMVHLVDIDGASSRAAALREPPGLRERIDVIEEDVTEGAADLVVRAVRDGQAPPEVLPWTERPIGDEPYDLVIGDLLYTQLLFPALLALGLRSERIAPLLRAFDPQFTGAVVARLHASAPTGVVVHLHDLACWSGAYKQPITLDEALADPSRTTSQLVRTRTSDPQIAVRRLGARVLDALLALALRPYYRVPRARHGRRVRDLLSRLLLATAVAGALALYALLVGALASLVV